MSKENEIAYLDNMAKILNIPPNEVEYYHLRKPFSDVKRGYYIMDIGQIMMVLPPAPARVLDLGVGSGWTSEMFARSGYSVLGLDIAPDMIKIAQQRIAPNLDLLFKVHDYEASIDFGLFDAVVIYDALHHATDETSVIKNCFHCLKPNGVFITMEPGVGHSNTPESLDAMKNFGTMEKDMEYSHQAQLMRAAGFGSIRQYLRLNQLPLKNVATSFGHARQYDDFGSIINETASGLTSLVVAIKDGNYINDPLQPIIPLTRGKSIIMQLQEDLEQAHSQLQNLQTEYERLQSHTQHTQAEYERLQSHMQHTQAEYERLQSHMQHTQAEYERLQSHMQHTHTENERLQSHMQHLEAEYKRLQSHMQHLEAEYERLQSHMQQLEAEYENSQAIIDAMKTSKFWKIRTQWFKIKKIMGLKTDD